MFVVRPACRHCTAAGAASGLLPSTSRCQHALFSTTVISAQDDRNSRQRWPPSGASGGQQNNGFGRQRNNGFGAQRNDGRQPPAGAYGDRQQGLRDNRQNQSYGNQSYGNPRQSGTTQQGYTNPASSQGSTAAVPTSGRRAGWGASITGTGGGAVSSGFSGNFNDILGGSRTKQSSPFPSYRNAGNDSAAATGSRGRFDDLLSGNRPTQPFPNSSYRSGSSSSPGFGGGSSDRPGYNRPQQQYGGRGTDRPGYAGNSFGNGPPQTGYQRPNQAGGPGGYPRRGAGRAPFSPGESQPPQAAQEGQSAPNDTSASVDEEDGDFADGRPKSGGSKQRWSPDAARERRREVDPAEARRIRNLPDNLLHKAKFVNPGKTERQLMEVKKKAREEAAARRAAEDSGKEQQVIIPSTVTVARLASLFGVRLPRMLYKMKDLEFSREKQVGAYILTSEEACEIAIDFGFDPIVDDDKAFDLLEEPEVEDGTVHPLRPPVVTIMGHVDHGKTTLLDALRNTAVAAGEAGGITQHIGAFSVPLMSIMKGKVDPKASISFLDTPGHAAFTAMRARGASVTDIIVLVVAADDGVMPQTKEVIELWKAEQETVGLVVAINKVDKHDMNVDRVKRELMANGIFLEEDGGEIPSVRVSGLKKTGLDDLVETLHTVAEVREIRARQTGKAEGYVLESRVDKGQGSMTTILVTRGVVRANSVLVAGCSWGRVRQMQTDQGKSIKVATPGMPVSIAGWRELPEAGDQFLEAIEGEEVAKRVVRNRERAEETRKLLVDTVEINAKRRAERMKYAANKAEVQALVQQGSSKGKARRTQFLKTQEAELIASRTKTDDGFKELRLIIKGDVSGSVEAVEQVLSVIGNKEAGVKVIMTGVGDISDSDVDMAEVCEAKLIAFNVSCSGAVRKYAEENGVKLVMESVIYRLIETVRKETAALLPPNIESRILGEATVLQLFDVTVEKRRTVKIAGSRVNNGTIHRKEKVRVLRGPDRTIVYEGAIETLKHLKKDVDEIRKGSECGIGLDGFSDIRVDDEIVTYQTYETPRTLD